MKITRNALNIPNLLQKPNKVQQEAKTQRKGPIAQLQVQIVNNKRLLIGGGEKLQISNQFKEVLRLKKQVMTQTSSPIRKEKIAQVKTAIAKGIYQVNAKGTAAKLLQNTIINNIYTK